jgi:enoyl-CoA hydratase
MSVAEKPVVMKRHRAMVSIILNRPEALNSLNVDMIRLLTAYVQEALADPDCRFILFYGNGKKGFCAGADIKELGQAAMAGDEIRLLHFFKTEYALDLMIHKAAKPFIVLAEGITMGGGLGIAAGADLVVAAESTLMAMPETLIGFFPDVGATGWMFTRCPPGYPEYLGLTGYRASGPECVRLGLATHWTRSENIPSMIRKLENYSPDRNLPRPVLTGMLTRQLAAFFAPAVLSEPKMDAWVIGHFSGKRTVNDVVFSLGRCGAYDISCDQALRSITERSPTALAVTLRLLRRNEHRTLDEVFESELKAARYMSRHPDYAEGIRARIIDRDNKPRWQPDSHDAVNIAGIDWERSSLPFWAGDTDR